ncbi:MAG: S8 family serine peptidase, partial [Planctomycetota bacterium]
DLRLEQFEDRVLLSINPTALHEDPVFSKTLADAVERAADLDNYTEASLSATAQWVVGLADGASSSDLATSLNAGSLGAASQYRNEYVWEFPSEYGWQNIVAGIESKVDVSYFYPLVKAEVEKYLIPNDPLFADQWHLSNTGQNGGTPGADAAVTLVWDEFLGDGVLIGIVDDGLEHTHEDLNAYYSSQYSNDFNFNDPDPLPDYVGDNHGTSVAGVAAANGDNGVGVSGAAPHAGLAGLRLISSDPNAAFNGQLVAQALTWSSDEIDIYNNSWGYVFPFTPLTPLELGALYQGVTQGRGGLGNIYVFSSGNSGDLGERSDYDGLKNSRFTIAVGALDHNGQQSYYSTPGASLFVSAPSNSQFSGITTTDRTGEDGYNASNDTDPLADLNYTSQFGGTSSATPLVSGVIALMLEANPALTYRDVQHILAQTSRQTDPIDPGWQINTAGFHFNDKYGFGAIDAYAAVEAAKTWETVGPEISLYSATVNVNQTIPDNDATGLEQIVRFGGEIGAIEWVEVTLDVNHGYVGDLEVVLESPSGTQSVLSDPFVLPTFGYNTWTFTTAANWGEGSAGDWRVLVRDRVTGLTGTWNSVQVTAYGTEAETAPPKLVVVIPNEGDLLDDGDVFHIAPRELLLRFNEGQVIDPNTLGGIQVYRAGADGVFNDGGDGEYDANDRLGDISVELGYIGIGDRTNEVIVRFAESLPDDLYQIQIIGRADSDLGDPLMNDRGLLYSGGEDEIREFELDLGAQVVAVVPQPITRQPDGTLQQQRNVIEVYFNEDELDLTAAQTTDFYQVMLTHETATPQDDAWVHPTTVSYTYDADKGGKVVLTFTDITVHYADGTSDPPTTIADLAEVGTGAFRLRVGNKYVDQRITTTRMTASEVGTSFYTADDVSALTGFGIGPSAQSLIISEQINALSYGLEWPGAIDEPGHRNLPNHDAILVEDHPTPADSNGDIPVYGYYFPHEYGTHPISGATLTSQITDPQRQRAREIFEIYGKYLGVSFMERESGGIAIITGDLIAVDPSLPNGPSGPGGIGGPGFALVNYTLDFGPSEFGGSWFQIAFHEIGHALGLAHSYDLPQFTIMGSSEDATTAVGAFEPVFPGDYDVVHGQRLLTPDSTDVDLYQFTLDRSGTFSAEIFAERMGISSALDAELTLYQQYTDTETVTVLELGVEVDRQFPVTRYRVVSRNDDYYSEDSYLEMYLKPGTYFVGVSASGNDQFDPSIDGSGIGGVSDGVYDLRVNFTPGGVDPDDTLTFMGDGTNHLVDTTDVLFDGDADGVPGGVYDFWFNVRAQADTIYVDKASPALTANGSIGAPFKEIDIALAAAQPGDIVRIVGNNFDNDTGPPADLTDNLPYEIGDDSQQGTLSDGSKMDVPKGVTVMIDAGAVFKLGEANIDVGSSAQGVDRSRGALQVLGIPGRPVYFTSHFDETIGEDTEPGFDSVGRADDWGGLVFRNRADYDFIAAYDPTMTALPREVLETQGIFLNYVNHADIRYGGGEVDGFVYSPVHMVEARPTVTYNSITLSAGAALSGDPNSFKDTQFQNWDITNPFTSDYDRVGPLVRNNHIVSNSVNGMYIRVTTPAGGAISELEHTARWDDWDVVHVVAENLFINGTPGGAYVPNATNKLSLIDNGYTIRAVAGDSIDDGETFSLFDGRTKLVFEFDRPPGVFPGHGVTPGHVEIYFEGLAPTVDTAAEIATKIAAVIHGKFLAGELEIDAVAVGNEVALTTHGPKLLTEGFGVPESRIDARLHVDPGMIVKLNGTRIEMEMGSQLIAEGRPGSLEGAPGYKVIFTSINDARYGAGGDFNTPSDFSGVPPAKGDWAGLTFGPVSEGSIDHALIAFGGGEATQEGGGDIFDPVEIRQATVRITNTRFESNDAGSAGDRNGRGFIGPATIYVRGAQPVIAGNDFLNNSGPILSIDVNALKGTAAPDWGRSTGPVASFDSYADNYGPLVRENRMTGNQINGMEVRGGILTTESIWDDTDVVHVLYNEVIVPNFQHVGGLRLQSSVNESLVVKLQGTDAGFTADGVPYEIDNRIGGSVQIIGTPGHPVVLTALSDDSVGAGFNLRDQPQFDTNGNGNSAGTPGAWRSVKLERYSNDRNVAVINEQEPAFGADQDVNNGTKGVAEPLGDLASSEKAGDDNLRLGFEVHGDIRIDAPADADVYSFTAVAGTEVWIDLDWTTHAFDAIVELIDEDGNVQARSDNSVNELATDDMYGDSPLLGSDADTFVRTMDRDPWLRHDFYTMNPRDAGMRVVLPGPVGTTETYYVRVRSSLAIGNIVAPGQLQDGQTFLITDGAGSSMVFELNKSGGFSPDNVEVDLTTATTAADVALAIVDAINTSGLDSTARVLNGNVVLDGTHVEFNPNKRVDDPPPPLLPPAVPFVKLGNTSGKYQLQVRLREMQEIAGSTVRYASIRYATNGIEVLGQPGHSPLLGESSENSGSNDVFGNAQDLGNLLEVDRNTLSVAGQLASYTDVDWYQLDIDMEGIQSIAGVNDRGSVWATIFDLDYADGLGGPDLAMWVFDSQGRLVLAGNQSNVADDRPEPIAGATVQNLSQGSVGAGDPFIGTAFLQEGNGVTYFVAISSTLRVPQELEDVSPLTRREPLNSVARIATENFSWPDSSGVPTNQRPYGRANYTPGSDLLGQRLVPIVDEFTLSDVTLYVNTSSQLYTVDPFSGEFETDVTSMYGGTYLPNYGSTFWYNDIAMRNDGRLMTLTAGGSGGGPGSGSQAPSLRRLSTEDARNYVTSVSTGIIVYEINPATPTALRAAYYNGVEFEALVHDPNNTGSRGRFSLAVGNVIENSSVAYGHNLVYLLDSNGTAVNHPWVPSTPHPDGARLTSNIVPVGQLYSAPTI